MLYVVLWFYEHIQCYGSYNVMELGIIRFKNPLVEVLLEHIYKVMHDLYGPHYITSCHIIKYNI